MKWSCSCAGNVDRTVSTRSRSKSGPRTQSSMTSSRCGQPAGAEVASSLHLEVVVGQPAVGAQLLLVGQVGPVGDVEVPAGVQVQPRPAAGGRAEDRPPDERLDRPREVVVQAGQRDVRAGVGVVDRVDDAVPDQGLAGVELPAEEGVDQPADGDRLLAGGRVQEAVGDRVPAVHRLVGVEVHDHRLGADGQAPREDLVAGDRLLQVHQPLPGLVVGPVQLVGVADHA